MAQLPRIGSVAPSPCSPVAAGGCAGNQRTYCSRSGRLQDDLTPYAGPRARAYARKNCGARSGNERPKKLARGAPQYARAPTHPPERKRKRSRPNRPQAPFPRPCVCVRARALAALLARTGSLHSVLSLQCRTATTPSGREIPLARFPRNGVSRPTRRRPRLFARRPRPRPPWAGMRRDGGPPPAGPCGRMLRRARGPSRGEHLRRRGTLCQAVVVGRSARV